MKSLALGFIISCLLAPNLWARAGAETVIAKIDSISFSYMDLPYLESPLGEGKGYDSDPLYRFDGFDCTTFVETVIAQALASNKDEFVRILNSIRYKNGQVEFLSRNHFTSVDWIKNNQANHLLIDVTTRLFPGDYAVSKTVIDKAAWALKNHQMTSKEPRQLSKLPYLPLLVILENPYLLDRISNGSIINIVRPNWQLASKIGTNLDVSHQGFAIWKSDGKLYFRHASQSRRKISEEPLYDYLHRASRDKTIGGINILELNL